MKDELRDRSGLPARAGKLPRWGAVLAVFFILHPSSFVLSRENFEPAHHYYKAKGYNVRVRWEVSRTTVPEGGDFTATLVVTGLVPPVEFVKYRNGSPLEVAAATIAGGVHPAEIVKPDLKALLPFASRFIFTDVPAPQPRADAKEVRFVYTLRPRNRAVAELPKFEFYYFNLRAAPGSDQFRRIEADAVPLTVTEAPRKAKPPPLPVDGSEFLFSTPTGPEVLGREPLVPAWWAWVLLTLAGPLVAVGWFVMWRRVFPDAVRLARRRRSRAARRATDAIRKAGHAADPPAAIARALLIYLRARFTLSEAAVTPVEIATALLERQVPVDAAEQTAAVFRACDRARFAPPEDRGVSLTADAEAVVARLEALA